MVNWKLLGIQETQKKWNNLLIKFKTANIYQSFEWGEYKALSGWSPYRWIASDEQNNIVALFQGLVRKYSFKTGMIWGTGGPVGNISFCGDSFRQTIFNDLNLKNGYCRFFFQRQYDINDTLVLKKLGWQRALYPINSGLSMFSDLFIKEEDALSACSKNWRRNLRRSNKFGLKFYQWHCPDPLKISSIYKEMESYKQLKEQFSFVDLKGIFEKLKNQIILFRCDDSMGNLLAIRGALIFGKQAWDFIAAANVESRKIYASYGLYWALARHCHSLGIKKYDMGGIDPALNPGVFNFKKGVGSVPVEYLGEWDWASHEGLRLGANWMINRKIGR